MQRPDQATPGYAANLFNLLKKCQRKTVRLLHVSDCEDILTLSGRKCRKACAVFVVEEKGNPHTMRGDGFPVGRWVRVISDSPFRGLKGTIQTVATMAPSCEDEESFCFYKIALKGAHMQECDFRDASAKNASSSRFTSDSLGTSFPGGQMHRTVNQ
jgi:hypothetical protein